ncbi:Hypothetical Protein XCAW_01132 [Xanthomonas citri subsp. citri Aw12879]|nr:Hypothetical Protein XCAW_01132 [Xanthomonas citri subsp. citri Aw12879]
MGAGFETPPGQQTETAKAHRAKKEVVINVQIGQLVLSKESVIGSRQLTFRE